MAWNRIVAVILGRMNRNLLLGLLAASAAIVIGSGWQLVSRYGVTTTLGPLDLALMRYGIPTLLLGPLHFRRGFLPLTASRPALVVMVLGGGLPFGLLVLAGARWAPAAHIGVVLAGGVPLFTVVAAWALRGERIGLWRAFGLACITCGMLVFAQGSLADASSSWRGDILFVLAAVLWAAYSLSFKRCDMTPWQGAAFVNGCSTVLLIPLLIGYGLPKLASAPWHDIAIQALAQGLIAGVLGVVVYTATIARLGASSASLTLALVPVVTTLGAAWMLHEPITSDTLIALALVVPGVALASGLARRTTRTTDARPAGHSDVRSDEI